MPTPPNRNWRPILDLALVVAVVGLLAVAYAIAGSSWPVAPLAPASPVVQTSVLGTPTLIT